MYTPPNQSYSRQPARRGGFGMRLLPIILFGLYLGYYWLSHREETPITGRTQLVDMTREEEAALGLQSYQQILAQEDVIQDGNAEDLVTAIGERIKQAAAPWDPGFDWRYTLIRDDSQINAFCLPGGKVAVYTGILPIAANPDGLAAIMGHEIAHALLRHGAERMAQQKLVQLGGMAASMATGDLDPGTRQAVMGAIGAGAKYGLLLPFSRDHESEADKVGLMLMAKACFDPREAPRLWERMGQASSGAPSEFMSTHPSHETRIRQLNEWMPEALATRAESCPDMPLTAP
jgi:metalloendopeptidase OMA1, mitochondrial